VQLLLAPFQGPVQFVSFSVATVLAATIVLIVLRAAMAAEQGRRGWVRAITSVNAKVFFALLFVAWALVFGIGLQFVPHVGANSPYGGLALIALFSGFFIMMGFLWAVIGE
jgi:hypothetical protein